MSPELEQYNLIATVGTEPAVITQVIWKYATSPTRPRVPDTVIVYTTTIGYEKLKSDLLDSGVWEAFCRDTLGGAQLDIHIEVPHYPNGLSLSDIRSDHDDMIAANKCYRLVDRLTKPGQPPLVGSIAGGRKTLSAHLMLAFTAFARREDQLVHVIGAGKALDPSYFYPPPGDAGETLFCIEMPFPRLAPYLERGFFQHLPQGERDLRAIMDGVRKFDYDPPARATVFVGRGRWLSSTVQLWDKDMRREDSFQIAPQCLATLLVLVQTMHDEGGIATAQALRTEEARVRYLAAAGLYRKQHDYAFWNSPKALSAAISRLNEQLCALPMAEEFMSIRRKKIGGKTGYCWRSRTPPALELIGSPDVRRHARMAGWDALYPAIQIKPDQDYE